MSKKKNKKRHSQSTSAIKKRAVEEELADFKDRDRKRLKPVPRAILLSDLVLLALTQLLFSTEVISDALCSILSLLGVVLLMVALWLQFGPGQKHDGPRTL